MKVGLRCASGVAMAASLVATPVWKAPKTMPYGQITVLELVEDDPSKPPLPRPGDDKLGPLPIHAAEPTPDGRGWRLSVQPLVPGIARIPAMDVGDGRVAPELRLEVPRTVPYGAPWMGVGGGQEDVLPPVPFPWAWASLLLTPLIAAGWWGMRRYRAQAPHRAYMNARRSFLHVWPPENHHRETLDAAHRAGQDLLGARVGMDAQAWSAGELDRHGLPTWARWRESLDAARFGRSEPPFPPLEALMTELEGRR